MVQGSHTAGGFGPGRATQKALRQAAPPATSGTILLIVGNFVVVVLCSQNNVVAAVDERVNDSNMLTTVCGAHMSSGRCL